MKMNYSDMQWVRQQGFLFTANGIFLLVSTRSNVERVSASCPRKVAPRKRGRAPPNNLLLQNIESKVCLIFFYAHPLHQNRSTLLYNIINLSQTKPLKHANSLHRQKTRARLYKIRLTLAAKTGINICPDHPASLLLLLLLVRHHQA